MTDQPCSHCCHSLFECRSARGRRWRWRDKEKELPKSACYVSFTEQFPALLNLCHGTFLRGLPEAVTSGCTTGCIHIEKLIQLLSVFISWREFLWVTNERSYSKKIDFFNSNPFSFLCAGYFFQNRMSTLSDVSVFMRKQLLSHCLPDFRLVSELMFVLDFFKRLFLSNTNMNWLTAFCSILH